MFEKRSQYVCGNQEKIISAVRDNRMRNLNLEFAGVVLDWFWNTGLQKTLNCTAIQKVFSDNRIRTLDLYSTICLLTPGQHPIPKTYKPG